MRKYSLRQTANRYLKTDNRGSFKDKKHRAYVLQKVIADLYVTGQVPAKWQGLTVGHIQRLVAHWKKSRIKDVTIMRYMTVIRTFLNAQGLSLVDIDNQSLNLSRPNPSRKKRLVTINQWQFITEICPRLIMALQMLFGLTYHEAVGLNPAVHVQPECLWITREIAFNSQDRIIPVRTKAQEAILLKLREYLQGQDSLLRCHGEQELRLMWRRALQPLKLSSRQCYRFAYARWLNGTLCHILTNYQLSWLIRDEMGIKSRNTLWLYLNESIKA